MTQMIDTQQQQLSTMIPFRYRILLYLNIFLIIVRQGYYLNNMLSWRWLEQYDSRSFSTSALLLY